AKWKPSWPETKLTRPTRAGGASWAKAGRTPIRTIARRLKARRRIANLEKGFRATTVRLRRLCDALSPINAWVARLCSGTVSAGLKPGFASMLAFTAATTGRCSATCSGRAMSGADMRRCSAAPQTRGCGLGSDSDAGSGAGCRALVPAATGARRGGMAGALRACRSGRRPRRLRCHPGVLRLWIGDRQCRAADRLRGREGLLRHDRGKPAVRKIQIGAGRIAARACAEIARIGNDAGIDRGDVTGIVCVPRPIGLAGAEREPAGQRADGGGSDDRRRVADPSDEPGRIDRVGGIVARGPAPQSVDIGPAAVMERRKPPGLDIDPVPAPRLDPAPIAVAVGYPADRHRAGEPYRAVAGDRAPAAVFVERLVPGHLRRDVVGRRKPVLVVIVGAAPGGKIVLARLLDRRGQRLRAADNRPVAGLHRDIEAAADKPRAALEHG